MSSSIVTNNHGGINSYNGTTFNIKNLEITITKKLEASIESSLITKFGIKFDAHISEISRSLDKLIDIKIRKYLTDNDIETNTNEFNTTMITYTTEEIEDIIGDNIEAILKQVMKLFPMLQDVSYMSLALTQKDPLVSSIPKVFDIKNHIIVHPETKEESIVITSDLLNYFTDSLLLNNVELEAKIRSCEENNNITLNERFNILKHNRSKWLQFLRRICKHENLKELFHENVKLNESSGKNITSKVSDILGRYIHQCVFGLSKLYCNDIEDCSDYQFALPTVSGFIYYY
jgi:hypothetical protein